MVKETFIGLERAIRKKKTKLKRHKKRYQQIKDSGICIWCKKRKVEPPHVRCKVCIKKIEDKQNGKANN
ncbi:hypothetical protein LCGC14_0570090 [marine sediment metagenome]|uniref:50S ribosomal protein L32 n=1 Tax=marine sediment metagenome TaxID=412755 RepID=A0A0F9S368_9ZZZZ